MVKINVCLNGECRDKVFTVLCAALKKVVKFLIGEETVDGSIMTGYDVIRASCLK